jgi:hypothetical protein
LAGFRKDPDGALLVVLGIRRDGYDVWVHSNQTAYGRCSTTRSVNRFQCRASWPTTRRSRSVRPRP